MTRLTAGLLLTAGVLLATPALAQFSSRGGPIDISANEVEIVDTEHLAVWRGAVDVLQNGNRLRANELKIYFAQAPAGNAASGAAAPGRSWGKVERAVADGDVFVISPGQTARGDHGVYDMAADTVTLTGDVVVAQGKSVVHGNHLVIDLKTNHATMASQGRVRGVFYPNTSAASGGPAPPPPRQP